MSIRPLKSLKNFRLLTVLAASAAVLAVTAPAPAASKVPLSFDDYHGYTATVKYLKDVAAAHP